MLVYVIIYYFKSILIEGMAYINFYEFISWVYVLSLPPSSWVSRSAKSTINHMFKKDLREEACKQVARFFYAGAISFNYIKNMEFTKMCEVIGKYGQGFKPPSYHHIREKYLKQEVKNVQIMHAWGI